MRRKGVTLVEALMVIGVLAILLGIAILVFHLVNNGNLSTKTQQEIFILKGVADTLTESAANYGYLGTADVAKSGMVPSRYINILRRLFGV